MFPANSNKIVQSLQRLSFAASRSFSAVAAPLTDPLEDEHIIPSNSVAQTDIQVSTLDNGIKVASLDNGGAISKVAVAIKAGSRYEASTQLGLSHLIKNAAFITNGGRSTLRTVRETQQHGATLDCSNSRELVSRTSAFMRNKLPEMMENMAPSIAAAEFRSWEMGDVKAHCANDIATLDPTAVNLELLHKAAFRGGLGNSVYCNELKLGGYGSADLEGFAKQQTVGGGISVVGTNVDHGELVRYAKDLLSGLPGGASDAAGQTYYGGDLRSTTSTGFCYASLVGAGAGLTSADLPVFAVLQNLLGSGTSIKWGSNTVSSRLNRATAGVADGPSMVTSLNVSYSDAGLFGVHAIAAPSSIGALLQASINEIRGLADVSAEEVEGAKTRAKTAALMLSEGSDEVLDDLVKQIALTGKYASTASLIKMIDSVTVEQVAEASKQLLDNPTLAITGDSSGTPYLDELL